MAEQPAHRWPVLLAVGLLGAVVLGLFADVLFRADPPVLSAVGGDTFREFIYWREFGFSQLRQGNLALWDPYVFCGIPFFGSLQSALLYPPNWLYMVLPVALAVNVGVAVHFFLAGLFMFLWSSHRGLGVPARTLAGLLYMCCGPHYMHLYPGHLVNLCAMAWAPLVMLSVDKLFDERRPLKWTMVGMGAVAMQILAGHPQTVYYTAIAALLYVLLRSVAARKELWADKSRAGHIGVGVVTIFVGAACLTAVQLWTGIVTAGESVRGPGVSSEFAATFAFPPENFLTLLAPGFFGDLFDQPYWGRWYLWEMCAFVSISGLWLAVYGAWGGNRASRSKLSAMVLICTVLALGSHTPLFDLLYHLVPGYDKFRANCKFISLAALFTTMLAGVGFDQILPASRSSSRDKHRRTWVGWAALATGLVLVVGAVTINRFSTRTGTNSPWQGFMEGIDRTGESFLNPDAYKDTLFAARAAAHAGRSLLIAGITCLIVGGVIFLSTRRARFGYALGLLAAVEIITFAFHERATFAFQDTRWPAPLEAYFSNRPDDGRLFWPDGRDNQGMIYHRGNVWGDDPGVLLRYAQFMTWTQGGRPDEATQYVTFNRYDPLYAMLRAGDLLLDERSPRLDPPAVEARGLRVHPLPTALPRAVLIEDYEVLKDRDAVFAAMRDPGFDPEQKVILERNPRLKTARGTGGPPPGTVTVTDRSTDERIVEAELSRPAILLLTDAYHTGWKALPEASSAQQSYEIIPANYVLQAIPLAAGTHHIRVVYLPASFRVGAWISVLSLLAYGVCLIRLWRRGAAHV